MTDTFLPHLPHRFRVEFTAEDGSPLACGAILSDAVLHVSSVTWSTLIGATQFNVTFTEDSKAQVTKAVADLQQMLSSDEGFTVSVLYNGNLLGESIAKIHRYSLCAVNSCQFSELSYADHPAGPSTIVVSMICNQFSIEYPAAK